MPDALALSAGEWWKGAEPIRTPAMSDTSTLGLADAARHLGVSVRVIRRAMRAGTLPAPPHLTATSPLPAGWLENAKAAVEASPKVLSLASKQPVPAFARFRGTSAWVKYPRRARDYASFRAEAAAE